MKHSSPPADRLPAEAASAPGEAAGPAATPTARRRLLTTAAAAGAVSVMPRFAIGQAAWPSKPIRIIVGTATGGLTDNFARQYGDFISRKFGQPVVVENRTGASGTIAADAVAKSAPDGHTFLVTISTTVWAARVLYRKLPYDPEKDLTPVTLFPSGALLMAVHEKIPARTVKEYVDYARKNKATFGTYSPASLPHMIADTLGRSRGIDIEPVHYKGEAPMWIDVASGQVNAALGSHQAMLPHIQRGSLRVIAGWGGRSPRMPEVPTFQEQGFNEPVFALNGWMPMCAPGGTPEDILRKMSGAILEARQTDKIKLLHESFGVPNVPPTLEESRKIWKAEAPEWIATADRLGVKLD
ncbi:MAG: tripartite tricarboxylate transporter substrate binding protein [Burkholderiales bacterium]|nr:tripartite tricarboxylate transporter substrate binding protein [Burkholderiales bacterium]